MARKIKQKDILMQIAVFCQQRRKKNVVQRALKEDKIFSIIINQNGSSKDVRAHFFLSRELHTKKYKSAGSHQTAFVVPVVIGNNGLCWRPLTMSARH